MNESIVAAPVSPLRQRMIEDMNMRRFSRETQLSTAAGFQASVAE